MSRERLLAWLEADRQALIDWYRGFVRVDTYNPPGDTRAGADYIRALLDAEALPYRIVAPEETMPNLLGSFDGARPGRHLVLNGHIDVFPAGPRQDWRQDPLGAALVEGRIYGRGTIDMKCGTTASIMAYRYLHRLKDGLAGRLTLTVVSDEETGGRWGTGYLLEHHAAEVLGDCVLNGEPSSPHTVRFGEKAMFWLAFEVATPGAHGAYPHLSASATKIAARLIGDLERLEEIRAEIPPNVAALLERPDVVARIEAGLGRGAVESLSRVTVNIGTLEGGFTVNTIPGRCRFTADIRLPLGVPRERVRAALRDILAAYPGVSVTDGKSTTFDATWSDPEHPMLDIVTRNAEAAFGFAPAPIVTLGGTDCRFFRSRGVPAYVFGPSPNRMGAPDEYVEVEEFLKVVRVHVLSAWDFLDLR